MKSNLDLKKILLKRTKDTEKTKENMNIANLLEVDFIKQPLIEKLDSFRYKGKNTNCYKIGKDNMILFYPLIDGMASCPFEFYKNGNLIISNINVYSEIINLDEILLQMVRIINTSLDMEFIINPYCFVLKLENEIKKNYTGKATLVMTENAIVNQDLQNFEETRKLFINQFLDHFIGWNFGFPIEQNKILENELINLNNKVIEMGIREFAGPGLGVVLCSDLYSSDTLIPYRLPLEKVDKFYEERNSKVLAKIKK